MSYQKLLQQMMGVTFLLLLLVGCGTPAATPMPPTATPSKVTVTKDLVYAKGMRPEVPHEWKLDEYAPTELGHWPVVLFLPGGGQIKEGYATLSQAISEQGAIVFVIDYPDIVPTMAILENDNRQSSLATSDAFS